MQGTAPDKEVVSTESDSPYHGEGQVVTCASCGRPASECDGGCTGVLDLPAEDVLLNDGV